MTDSIPAATTFDAYPFPQRLSSTSSAQPSARPPHAEFEHHVRRHHDDLYRFAYWLTGDRSVAEDALQEALIRAWQSWGTLRDKDAAKPWLLTIVRRECARMYERKRYPMVDIDELLPSDEHAVAVEDDVEQRDVYRAILGLGKSYREPLLLQVLMGYSAEEIAAVIGIRPGAVLTRLCRARQKLAEDLAPEGP